MAEKGVNMKVILAIIFVALLFFPGAGFAAYPEPSPYAFITEQSFAALPQQQGLWRGKVKGNGRVHLKLEIFKEGKVIMSRYMGNVFLINKSSTFAFKTTLPSENGWRWRIVTSAERA